MKHIFSKTLLICSILFITSSCSVQEDELLNDDLESFNPLVPNPRVPGKVKIRRVGNDPNKPNQHNTGGN